MTTFHAEYKGPTPLEINHDPLSQATRKAFADEKNRTISMRNIVATVASDVDKDANTPQKQRLLCATRNDGMHLDVSDHANKAQATVDVPPPPQTSVAKFADRTAADKAISTMMRATPVATLT